MLIYREEINMTIISHALGAKMIDTTIAAGVVKMLHDENEYGDRVYEMVPDMASTTWVLLEPHSGAPSNEGTPGDGRPL